MEAPKPVKKLSSPAASQALRYLRFQESEWVWVSHRYLNHPLYHGHCALIVFNPNFNKDEIPSVLSSHPAILSTRAAGCTDQPSALTSHFNATEGQVPVLTNVLAIFLACFILERKVIGR